MLRLRQGKIACTFYGQESIKFFDHKDFDTTSYANRSWHVEHFRINFRCFFIIIRSHPVRIWLNPEQTFVTFRSYKDTVAKQLNFIRMWQLKAYSKTDHPSVIYKKLTYIRTYATNLRLYIQIGVLEEGL